MNRLCLKSSFEDDAGPSCAGLAVCRCVDFPAWPLHSLPSPVRPGVSHIAWISCQMFNASMLSLRVTHPWEIPRTQSGIPPSLTPTLSARPGTLNILHFILDFFLIPILKTGNAFYYLVKLEVILTLLARFHPAHMLKDPAMERKGRL